MQFRIRDHQRCEMAGALAWVQLDELVETGLNFCPALCIHERGSPLSSSASHALAARRSRLAVASDNPIALALSSRVKPPKYRCCNSCLWRGRSPSRRFSASSKSATVSRLSSEIQSNPSRSNLLAPPPRFAAKRERARSTSRFRMTSEASPRKCARSGRSTRGAPTSRMYASWTSSVVLSEFSTGEKPKRRCAIARSRSYTRGMSRSRALSSPALHCRRRPVTSDDAGAIPTSRVRNGVSSIRVLRTRSKQNEPVRAAIPFQKVKEGQTVTRFRSHYVHLTASCFVVPVSARLELRRKPASGPCRCGGRRRRRVRMQRHHDTERAFKDGTHRGG